MGLARAAAARTLADWAEPQQPPHTPSAEPQPNQPVPPQADHQPASHANPAPNRPAGRPATPAPAKPTDPAVLFTRLAAVVRDCIALEARIAAGATPRAPKPQQPPPEAHADSRREPLLEAFRFVTAKIPNRAATLRDITARLDEELASDPDQAYGSADFLACICEDFGIAIDYTKLPDEYLFHPIDPPYADYDDPRATSPP